jgi:Lrp/AsnC family transcriptional regulator, regulator for asnA, asnC and gidA
VTNPLQFGYQIWAWTQVQVEGPRIRSVASELAQAPEIYFVGIMAGNFDILVGAVFRTNKELLDFITNRVPRIRGIVRTSTSSILEVVKRTMATGIADDAIANGSSRSHHRRRRGPP